MSWLSDLAKAVQLVSDRGGIPGSAYLYFDKINPTVANLVKLQGF